MKDVCTPDSWSEGIDWVEQTLWQAGAHLMGRRTYAGMVGYWPTSTEPLAAPMNAVPKIVFSRSGRLALEPTTAPTPGWENTRVFGSDLSAGRTDEPRPGRRCLAGRDGSSP